MKRASGLVLLVCGLGGWSLGQGSFGADASQSKKNGVVVEIDGLKSRTPADWKEERAANRMRAYQFRIPHVKGDKQDTELVIFFFGTGSGGTAADNIKRWKGMFIPPDAKKIDDVAKVTRMKVGDVPVTYLDIHGTYVFKNPPFAPNAKVERRPNYRMLGVVFESPKGPYFFRLVGPAKTVEDHKKGFDQWLKGFK